MTSLCHGCIKIIIALILLFNAQWLGATEVEGPDLAPSSNLLVTEVSNRNPVVGEQVVLQFELLVHGFFNAGTEFELPSMARARLSRASSFAINGSKTIAGKSYSSQIWQVYLYPEQQGLIEVPAVRFKLKFMDSAAKEAKTVELSSKAQMLFAYIPAGIDADKPFIVADSVMVEEQWSQAKQSYQVGDVIERQLTFKVTNLPAMNIPRFTPMASEGIKIIAAEATLTDQSNRGENIATVRQSFHYIIEQAGEYQLGGEPLIWWQTQSGLQQQRYSSRKLVVAGVNRVNKQGLLIIATVFVILLGLLVSYRFNKLPLRAQLTQALFAKDWRRFINLLYRRADNVVVPAILKPSPSQIQSTIDKSSHKRQLLSELFISYFGADGQSDSAETGKKQVKWSFMDLFRYLVSPNQHKR